MFRSSLVLICFLATQSVASDVCREDCDLPDHTMFLALQVRLSGPEGASKEMGMESSAASSSLSTAAKHRHVTLKEEDPAMPFLELVAISVPCFSLSALALGGFMLKDWRTPDRTAMMTPRQNWAAIRLVEFATAFAYVNLGSIVANTEFNGNFATVGFPLALYALGALLSLPFYMLISPKRPGVGIMFHAFCAFGGNLGILLGMVYGKERVIIASRVAVGMEFGIIFFADLMTTHLTQPGKDRESAVMDMRLASAGQAIGFLLRPELLVLFGNQVGFWSALVQWLPQPQAQHQLFTTIVMCAYSLCMLVERLFSTMAQAELIEVSDWWDKKTASEQKTKNVEASPRDIEHCWMSLKMFSAIFVNQVTRGILHQVTPALLALLLATTYHVPSVTSATLFLMRMSLPIAVVFLLKVKGAVRDVRRLLWITEALSVLGLPFLYTRWTPSGPEALASLVFGYLVIFSVNIAQSASLKAVMTSYVVYGDQFLNNVMVSFLMFVVSIGTWCFAPLIGYTLLLGNLSQHSCSALLAAFVGLHAIATWWIIRKEQSREVQAHRQKWLYEATGEAQSKY